MHVGFPYEAANPDDVPAGARLAAPPTRSLRLLKVGLLMQILQNSVVKRGLKSGINPLTILRFPRR